MFRSWFSGDVFISKPPPPKKKMEPSGNSFSLKSCIYGSLFHRCAKLTIFSHHLKKSVFYFPSFLPCVWPPPSFPPHLSPSRFLFPLSYILFLYLFFSIPASPPFPPLLNSPHFVEVFHLSLSKITFLHYVLILPFFTLPFSFHFSSPSILLHCLDPPPLFRLY